MSEESTFTPKIEALGSRLVISMLSKDEQQFNAVMEDVAEIDDVETTVELFMWLGSNLAAAYGAVFGSREVALQQMQEQIAHAELEGMEEADE